MTATPKDTLELDGRIWFRNALSATFLKALDEVCTVKAGERLKWISEFHQYFGPKSEVGVLVQSVLPDAKPTRVVSFNKHSGSNWVLPWHQDRVIAVSGKCDVEGYSNWSQKQGVWHCEPPVTLLERMVFVRVHLDDSNDDNGALELSLRSHRLGLVPAGNAPAGAESLPRELCCAARGDVIIIKMLTLHRSLASQSQVNRRALRIDYSSDSLPPPLEWATC